MRFLSTVSIPLIGWAILSVAWPAPAAAGTSFGVNRIRYVEATGTPEENCQSLKDTLSSITDNSFDHRYLVQLEPGRYNCGIQSLVVGGHFVIAGSGKRHTSIYGLIDNNLIGVVHLAGSRSMLRDLTVANTQLLSQQKAIGISINTFFSDGPLDDIELQDVIVGGSDLAVYANNASIGVWNSYLNGGVQHDASTDPSDPEAVASFYYSILLHGVQGTGTHTCRFSGTETGDFGLACEHPDTN